MKVLKPGRKQKGWAKEFQCSGAGNGLGGCQAVLLVEQGDVFQTSKSLMGRDTDYFQTFKCCECGVLTDIQESLPFTITTKEEWDKAQLAIKLGGR